MHDDGVISIEVLPSWSPSELRSRLAQSVDSAAGLSAAVAYWTVGPNFVSPNLSARIAPRNGFLCVDLHLPTDIDNLAELKRAGGNVYLFILDVKTVSDHGNDEKRWLSFQDAAFRQKRRDQ